MSDDHFREVGNMIRDTPISDTPISDSTPHNVGDLAMACRRLERKLDLTRKFLSQATEQVKQLETENDAMRADLLLWNEKERIKRLETIISRAKNKFFRHGSNGTAASGMLDILGEVRKP